MTLFSNKLKPNEWLSFVEGAVLEHGYARQSLNSWMNGVDILVGSWGLEEKYSPLLSVPSKWSHDHRDYNPTPPETNLYDFFNHQEKANDFISQAISRIGEPKLLVNHWRTYTAALMNQEVMHATLTLVFLYQVRFMASGIYCSRNKIDGRTFEPRLKAIEGVERFMEIFYDERSFYASLRSGNDIWGNRVDLTDGDLIRHFDLVMYERVNTFPRLAEKIQADCSSLLPWVLGESTEIDLSSFSFDPV